ncbi:MAG: UDP-N-acetylmuramoyl-L-alanyl-D-glutamate--2,6-diaminopimelate ligase [Alphaproteobacteria bacterium]
MSKTSPRPLGDLTADVPGLMVDADALSQQVTGITEDSRQVGPGSIFVAMKGSVVDGRSFIPQAAEAGAKLVLAEHGTQVPDGVTLLAADNPRAVFARLAAGWHGPQPKHIAAVTGTNGKTSTAQFTHQFWSLLDRKAAAMGNLGITNPDGSVTPTGVLNTPMPMQLHSQLAGFAEQGIDRVAFEASSHGLDQHRLDGVRVSAAGFTNLTRDHLDYHGTEQAYFEAKARLFSEVMPRGGVAVLNADVPHYPQLSVLARDAGHKVLSYGEKGLDLRVERLEPEAGGQKLIVQVMGSNNGVMIPMIGRFQVWNILAALGLVIASGEEWLDALRVIDKLQGVRGRMEKVADTRKGAAIYVDYAHTPDAIETVLTNIRPHVSGKLHCLFGCGGDRDKGKRPQMAEAAARYADKVIITDDNPRSEDPATIRADAQVGAPDAMNIGGRADAIREAVSGLGKGDVLVIAGKGHEQGQTIGAETLPFDDATEARKAVKELKA